jgi:SAM-dependent methyltransferase
VPAQARGYQVTATDASVATVARLAAEHPGLDVRRMDAAELRFADGTFDVVTAGFVMHLLDDPPAVIAAVRALLTPGGLFAFTTPGRVPDGFEFADIAHDLFGELAQYVAPGRILSAGFG